MKRIRYIRMYSVAVTGFILLIAFGMMFLKHYFVVGPGPNVITQVKFAKADLYLHKVSDEAMTFKNLSENYGKPRYEQLTTDGNQLQFGYAIGGRALLIVWSDKTRSKILDYAVVETYSIQD